MFCYEKLELVMRVGSDAILREQSFENKFTRWIRFLKQTIFLGCLFET
jgi:hypothetical protein